MHKLKALLGISKLKQLFARLFSRPELCTIHFYYTAKGVVGATKTPKVESIFAWINLSKSTKEDCIHLFKLPTCDNSRITIKDVVIVPVPKVRYSK